MSAHIAILVRNHLIDFFENFFYGECLMINGKIIKHRVVLIFYNCIFSKYYLRKLIDHLVRYLKVSKFLLNLLTTQLYIFEYDRFSWFLRYIFESFTLSDNAPKSVV